MNILHQKKKNREGNLQSERYVPLVITYEGLHKRFYGGTAKKLGSEANEIKVRHTNYHSKS